MLWVRADRAHSEELFDTRAAAAFEELNAHEKILVEKGPRPGGVRADAADYGRQVNDDLGTMLLQEASDRKVIGEIALPAAGGDERSAPPLP
jgi:hypothetical protein